MRGLRRHRGAVGLRSNEATVRGLRRNRGDMWDCEESDEGTVRRLKRQTGDEQY